MLFIQQKSIVLLTVIVALLALIGNPESRLVRAEVNDKEDKDDKKDDDDEYEGPVPIVLPESPPQLVISNLPDLSSTANTTFDVEAEEGPGPLLPAEGNEGNGTVWQGDDALLLEENCACLGTNGTVAVCSDPRDEDFCTCDEMGDLFCGEEGHAFGGANQSSPVFLPAVADGAKPPAPPASSGATRTKQASGGVATAVSLALSVAGAIAALD